MNLPGHDALHDQLDALGVAVDAGDMDTAAQCMTDYDAALRCYMEATAPHTPLDVLRELLKLQNALLLRMRERQAEIGALLRQSHRQDSASRAYADVELAP